MLQPCGGLIGKFIRYFSVGSSTKIPSPYFPQVLVLAGLGLGAGVAVGSVGAAIGLASARQEVAISTLNV